MASNKWNQQGFHNDPPEKTVNLPYWQQGRDRILIIDERNL